MKYDGTPENIRMNPYLTAKLDAREEKGWGPHIELYLRCKAGPLTKGYTVCCSIALHLKSHKVKFQERAHLSPSPQGDEEKWRWL
jgi:hypothetical protein